MWKRPLPTRVALLGVAVLVGCWTSSPPPARRTASETAAGSDGASHGGAQYDGSLSARGTNPAADGGSPYSGSVRVDSGDGIGRIGGGGGGAGYGGGGRIGGQRSSGVIDVSPLAVSLGLPSGQLDALDPAIIRRHLWRNIAEIRRCYALELAKDPELAGMATVDFSIDGSGKVTQSTGSGMPPVDKCVASVISTLEFPAPKGGVTMVLRYPFHFSLE